MARVRLTPIASTVIEEHASVFGVIDAGRRIVGIRFIRSDGAVHVDAESMDKAEESQFELDELNKRVAEAPDAESLQAALDDIRKYLDRQQKRLAPEENGRLREEGPEDRTV